MIVEIGQHKRANPLAPRVPLGLRVLLLAWMPRRTLFSAILLTSMLLLGTATAALAQPGRRGAGGPDALSRIMTMDADQDGKLSADELPQHLRREVSLMDGDGDGYIDASEIEALQSLAARPRPARKTQR